MREAELRCCSTGVARSGGVPRRERPARGSLRRNFRWCSSPRPVVTTYAAINRPARAAVAGRPESPRTVLVVHQVRAAAGARRPAERRPASVRACAASPTYAPSVPMTAAGRRLSTSLQPGTAWRPRRRGGVVDVGLNRSTRPRAGGRWVQRQDHEGTSWPTASRQTANADRKRTNCGPQTGTSANTKFQDQIKQTAHLQRVPFRRQSEVCDSRAGARVC